MRGFGMLLVLPEATMREAAMAHATAVLPNTRARLYSFFMPVYNPVSARSCETVVKPLQKCTEMAFASNPVAPARPETWLSFALARAQLDTATGARLWRSPAALRKRTSFDVGGSRCTSFARAADFRLDDGSFEEYGGAMVPVRSTFGGNNE